MDLLNKAKMLMAISDIMKYLMLFQLKDDAVKKLQSICQQIWKTQQWP